MPNNPRSIALDPEQIEKFKAVVAAALSSPWSVLHAQVDLDGLGCTYGKVEILRGLGKKAFPFHAGLFDDPQNIHVHEVLKLGEDLRPISAMPKSGPVALVDSCRLRDGRFGVDVDPKRILSIDDHHLPDDDPELAAPWRYVHIAECGAACTIVWEQAKALGVELTPRTCTLIALGIHSDTNKLRSPATTLADCIAYAESRERSDQAMLADCFHYPLPPRFFDLSALTSKGRKFVGPAIVSHPGRRMHVQESGFISRYADRFLQYPGPKLAIVWCLTETHVRASFRTEDLGFDLVSLIDHVFGKGNGGAKHGSGGALVPIGQLPLGGCHFDDEMIARIDELVHERLECYFGKTAH